MKDCLLSELIVPDDSAPALRMPPETDVLPLPGDRFLPVPVRNSAERFPALQAAESCQDGASRTAAGEYEAPFRD